MIHSPLAAIVGNAEDLEKEAELLAKLEDTQSDATVREWMRDEKWFTGKEAQEVGLTDEVVDAMSFSASADLGRYKNLPEGLVTALRTPEPHGRERVARGIRAQFEAEARKIAESIPNPIAESQPQPVDKPLKGKYRVAAAIRKEMNLPD
jgi:hypothetical protein